MSPPIGLPGLIAVAAYLATALRAFQNARNVRSAPGAGGFTRLRAAFQRRCWMIIAGLFVMFGVDKLFDLEPLLAAVPRNFALRQGWYAAKTGVQLAFIAAAILGGLIAIVGTLVAVRRAGGWTMLGLAGAGALLIFIVVRTTSLHDIDWLLRVPLATGRFGAIRVGHLIELGGIATVIFAAIGFRMANRGGAGPRRRR